MTMKKVHFVLLVVTAVMALFSAYSLAAMNQIYKVYFDWYSEYNNKYMEEYRDTSMDKWQLQEYSQGLKLAVIGKQSNLKQLQEAGTVEKGMNFDNFGKYIYIFCTLGQVDLPEYRIKVIDIAQRGDTVEVKVSLNSPVKRDEKSNTTEQRYNPRDIIRIDKNTFPTKGKLYFIFKDQDGNQIGEQYCDVY